MLKHNSQIQETKNKYNQNMDRFDLLFMTDKEIEELDKEIKKQGWYKKLNKNTNTKESLIEKIISWIKFDIIEKIKDIYASIVSLYNKQIRGYTKYDTWNLNDFIIERVRPVLKEYISMNRSGCICELFDESIKDDECHKWNEILIKINDSFDLYYLVNFEGKIPKKDKNEEVYKTIQEGFELFGKYLTALWD